MTAARRDQLVSYVVLGVFSVIALYPILSIVLLALHRRSDLVTGFSIPHTLDFGTFKEAWEEGAFGRGLLNSFIVAASVSLATAVLSTLAGYAFGAMRFRGSDALFYLLLLGLIFPYEATVIPLYYVFKDYGLTDTYWALILPQIGLSIPFGTFWMRAFFRSSPSALVEASRLDGASSFTTLWRVLLPQAWPAITTMIVLVFMWTWNEFLLALVMIQSDSLRTAPLGLALFAGANRTSAQDVTLVAAAAVLVALPVVVVYVFLQRSFIRGMFAGAVKE
jgi:raffinose/stachyose/melibiose transport system permease protein